LRDVKLIVLGAESGALRFGAVEEGSSVVTVKVCWTSAILKIKAG
jgi:hypothetical protein